MQLHTLCVYEQIIQLYIFLVKRANPNMNIIKMKNGPLIVFVERHQKKKPQHFGKDEECWG
jgi:hypothetical protein